MRKSNPTFLKRQKELARQQRKAEKQQRIHTRRDRETKGPEIADENDLAGLGLDPTRFTGITPPPKPPEGDGKP